MFRIAVCDDEPAIGSSIENILLAYGRRQGLDLEVDVFHSGEELCAVLERGEVYHLLYLDVCMKLLDGIEVSRRIRDDYRDDALQIVYVSASRSHTLQMFENRPLNFLPKPFDEAGILKTLRKARSLLSMDESYYEFQNGNRQYRVNANEIVYFESDNKKILVHTISGTLEFYGKLSQVDKEMSGLDFVWIHKSYLVNYRHIREAQYDTVLMSTGISLPISQTYRKQVRDFMLQRRKGEAHV